MATTLRADSFADINILEVTTLTADAAAGATTITVKSTAGYSEDQALYLGTLGQDGCELAYVSALTSATVLTLTSALALPHAKYQPVTSVVGDTIRIHRAANVDGTAPTDASFALLATRQIDADQQSTYYVDSEGGSDSWYKLTYFNATTLTETDLAASEAVRGDDFGHYASLSEIRSKAGFDKATNLSDSRIDIERRAAEAEINTSLSDYYTVPFTKPFPEHIRTLTIQLAAGLLLMAVYGDSHTQGKELVKGAREQLKALRTDGGTLSGTPEADSAGDNGVSYYPDSDTDRAFEGIWDRF